MVDSNFFVYYEHDQNEAKHFLSIGTHGAGPLTEDGRWVLIGKVGEAATASAAAEAEAPADAEAEAALAAEMEVAEGFGEGFAEGLGEE
eukprot:1954496-Prymnesium_polylepis.1